MTRRVMIVTAGRQQAPLILKAKAMHCEVLATDNNVNAPSLSLADRVAIVDAASHSELLRIAREFRPQAIVSEQTDIAVPAVAFVAETLGLPGIGYEAAIRATNKWEMRLACRRAGLPTPEYRLSATVEEVESAARDIGLPVVIKPVDNQASRGVTKVVQFSELPMAAARAFAASRSGRVLVEDLMVGTECSIESFICGDTIHVLGWCDKIKSKPPYSFDLQLVYPGAFPAPVVAEIKDLNANVIRAIGLRMGFAHAEMIVTSKGVRLIEIAARGCGAGVATTLLPYLTGIDLLQARLRQALGENVEIPEFHQNLVGVLRFFELPSGTVQRIIGLDEAVAEPGVIDIYFTPSVGTCLSDPISADQRPGFILAAARSRTEALCLVGKVVNVVKVEVAARN